MVVYPDSTTTRPPPPPGKSLPACCWLRPPIHIVLVSLQFTFANAGVAALKLVVVAAAIMTAVVINITEFSACFLHHAPVL
jgi:hypothetical protein